jgi:Bacterial SH3 domain
MRKSYLSIWAPALACALILSGCAIPGVPTATPSAATPAATGSPPAAATEVPTAAPTVPATEAAPPPAATPTAAAALAVAASLPASININTAGLAETVRAESRSPLGGEPGTPDFVSRLPAHVRIVLGTDTPNAANISYRERQILVVPVEAYLDNFASDPTLQAELRKEVKRLRALIRRRSTRISGPLPLFPPTNASQVFHSNVRFLSFTGGAGMRFLSHYAQDASPVTRDEVFYTFQGLTSDGRFLVAAFFPVSTEALPAADALPAELSAEAERNFDTYLRGVVRTLERQRADGFAPQLVDLDAVMQSIEVKSPTVVPAADAAALRTTTSVNLRASPTTRSRVIVLLRRNTALTPLGRNDAATWVKVRTARGQEGWVSAEYVRGIEISTLAVAAE